MSLGKNLSYSINNSIEVDNQWLTIINIENLGNVPLTSLQINITGLNTTIDNVIFPGPNEQINIIDGGSGSNFLKLTMGRLSQDLNVSIILITSENLISLKENTVITSKEVIGIINSEGGISIESLIISLIIILLVGIFIGWTIRYYQKTNEVLQQDRSRLDRLIDHLDKS